MSEANTMRAIQLAMSPMGHRLFRNNVGMLTDRQGNKVRYGLCIGSSDLIGFTASGRFLAIEVKSEDGDPTIEQLEFIETVNRHGGIAFVARNVDEAMQKLKDALCRTN